MTEVESAAEVSEEEDEEEEAERAGVLFPF
jgi:hypothetical protein